MPLEGRKTSHSPYRKTKRSKPLSHLSRIARIHTGRALMFACDRIRKPGSYQFSLVGESEACLPQKHACMFILQRMRTSPSKASTAIEPPSTSRPCWRRTRRRAASPRRSWTSLGTTPVPPPPSPATGPQLASSPDLLSECDIHVDNTKDGVILPVRVHKKVPSLILTNYTRTEGYARYLNDSRFTGVGIGSADDWVVIFLATSTQQGSYSSRSISGRKTGPGLRLICLMIVYILWLILSSH